MAIMMSNLMQYSAKARVVCLVQPSTTSNLYTSYCLDDQLGFSTRLMPRSGSRRCSSLPNHCSRDFPDWFACADDAKDQRLKCLAHSRCISALEKPVGDWANGTPVPMSMPAQFVIRY